MLVQNQSEKQWGLFSIWILTSTLMLLLLIGACLFALMKRSGEYLDPVMALEQQRQSGGLYRSALTDDMMSPSFRFARYDVLLPEIIALGSSRVLQFRQSHFTRPFANMGMSVDYAVLPNIATALLQNPNLKFVLLDIDHWQVNETVMRQQPDSGWSPRETYDASLKGLKYRLFDLREVYLYGPLRLVWEGKLGLRELGRILCRCDEGGPSFNLGMSALVDGSGIDVEGSYHYTWVFDHQKSNDGFSEFLRRINTRTSGFQVLQKASSQRVEYIKQAIDILQRAGITVISFVPPLPPTVTQAMDQTRDYGVMEDMNRAFRFENVPFYNFNNSMATIQSPDCEFADGLHGGEVTYLRMLKKMANDNASLKRYVNMQRLNDMIDSNAGHVNAYKVPRSGNRSRREVDFLGIGCNK